MAAQTRVLVFAKAPLPGFAKTRLVPTLGEEGAARLAGQLLQATLEAALAADLGPVELCATPAPDSDAWRGVSLPSALAAVTDQGSGDLGERLARAARRTLASATAAPETGELPRVLLVGTDCVEMSAALLLRAAAALDDADAVLYPAADGGYALLGLKRTDDSLFHGIPWGGTRVAEKTVGRLEALGWRLFQGEQLHDIDRPEDLHWLDKIKGLAGANPTTLWNSGS